MESSYMNQSFYLNTLQKSQPILYTEAEKFVLFVPFYRTGEKSLKSCMTWIHAIIKTERNEI